jgi:hypothetical protein
MEVGWHEELIKLYNPSGRLTPATYSIKFVPRGRTASGTDPFTLVSLAAGVPGAAPARGDYRPAFPLTSEARIRPASFEGGAYDFTPEPFGSGVPLGLASMRFSPREIRVQRDGPAAGAVYSFRTTVPFDGGARADVRRVEGGVSARVNTRIYDRRLEPGETLDGAWDCMSGGAHSFGRHVLFVNAWYTVQVGGMWSALNSSPVQVRR